VRQNNCVYSIAVSSHQLDSSVFNLQYHQVTRSHQMTTHTFPSDDHHLCLYLSQSEDCLHKQNRPTHVEYTPDLTVHLDAFLYTILYNSPTHAPCTARRDKSIHCPLIRASAVSSATSFSFVIAQQALERGLRIYTSTYPLCSFLRNASLQMVIMYSTTRQ